MKILKPTAYYEPEQVSSSHLDKDLEEAFLQAGFDYIIVAPSPTRDVSKETRIAYKKIKYEQKFDGKLEIFRIPVFREGRNPVGRAWRYFWSSLKIYRKCIKQQNVDIVFAASTPPIQGILAAKIAKKLKVPFIYNLQDIFPDSLVNAKMAKKGSFIWKIGRKIEDFTYFKADKIIVISDDLKNNLLAKGVQKEKIDVVHNWINLDNVYYVENKNNSILRKIGLSEKDPIITYAGNIGFAQDIISLIKAFEIINITKRVYFVIFGNGSEYVTIKNYIESYKLQHFVLLYPKQPQELVSEVYSLGLFSMISCLPGFGDISVPSKTYSILATGTPIIANFDLDSELCNMIVNNSLGKISPSGEIELLAENIIEAIDNYSYERKKIRAFVKENYSSFICTTEYVKIIRRISFKRK
ncbi:glycosyltransferase family 4 protein [uncultured Sphaerochaeta sp.]|uniref:glycosyltransferase family 4 protein n=1 Tax=uncultured Sphaerochaeta sp. TaxID=886478 RepID=UPI002A0A8D33|nr:glycosyltransferase family 4 protein [uncultured Sphaerochaeta sp.]